MGHVETQEVAAVPEFQTMTDGSPEQPQLGRDFAKSRIGSPG